MPRVAENIITNDANVDLFRIYIGTTFALLYETFPPRDTKLAVNCLVLSGIAILFVNRLHAE